MGALASLLVVLPSVLFSPIPVQAEDAVEQSTDPEGEPYAALLERYAASGWSGAALVVQAGRIRLARGYGFADFPSNRSNDAHTLFDVAELTQAFTALAIGRLAQRGELALDDALAVHLSGVPEHSRAITLRQLLAHTSGIPNRSVEVRGGDPSLALLDQLGTGPSAAPGRRHEPWNGGFALLAAVIERTGEQSYVQFVEQELFAPAGMAASGFTGDADLDPERAALGATPAGPARRALEPLHGAYDHRERGTSGLVTSVHDLAAFEHALANHVWLDEAHTRELFTPVVDGQALGWRVGRALDGRTRLEHGGSTRGFASLLRRYPDAGACIALLCNDGQAHLRALADNLECLLLGRALSEPPPRLPLLTEAERAAIAGNYAGTAGRLVVQAAPGTLMAGVEGLELLERLGQNEELVWKADLALFARRAVEVVEGLARGDTQPLRTHVAKRIARTWPDHLRTRVWPAQLARHGEFRGARPLGAVTRAARVEVLLALEHERGPARALVTFGPAGLEQLDLAGPRFLVSGRLEPVRKDVFRLILGDAEKRLEFTLAGAAAESVRLGGCELSRH